MILTEWIPNATQLPMFSFHWIICMNYKNPWFEWIRPTRLKNVAMIGLNNSKYKDWFFKLCQTQHDVVTSVGGKNLSWIWSWSESVVVLYQREISGGSPAFASHKKMFIFSVQKLKSTQQTALIMTFLVRGCRHLAEWSPTHTHR